MKKYQLLSLFTLLITLGAYSQTINAELLLTLPGLEYSSLDTGDVNNDGYTDFFISGSDGDNNAVTKLYINQNDNNFQEASTSFVGLDRGELKVFDYNNDKKLDIIMSGEDTDDNERIILYRNNGNLSFTKIMDHPFEDDALNSISIADLDTNGYKDVLITGYSNSQEGITAKLYYNNNGVFSESQNISTSILNYTAAKFSDVDNDNDLDFLIIGGDSEYRQQAHLYLNDGHNNFAKKKYSSINFTPFQKAQYGSLDFFDFDKDNDEDALITGSYGSTLHLNSQPSNFAKITPSLFDGVAYSSTIITDLNNDDYLDVIISGLEDYSPFITTTKFYINDKNGSFIKDGLSDVLGSYYGDIKIIVTKNGDKLLIVTGKNNAPITKIYKITSNECVTKYGVDNQVHCNKYTWIDGKTYTSNNNTAEHLIEKGSSTNCDSIVKLNLTINQVVIPVTIESSELTTEFTALNYQWLDCNNNYTPLLNESTNTLTPASEGSYALEIKTNECIDTSSCILYQLTLGLSKINITDNFEVYPNPNSDDFFMIKSKNITNYQLKIYNLDGTLIQSHFVETPSYELTIEKQGVYFVEFQTNKTTQRYKIIKN